MNEMIKHENGNVTIVTENEIKTSNANGKVLDHSGYSNERQRIMMIEIHCEMYGN